MFDIPIKTIKHKNMFELCYNIQDLENRGKMMVKKCFVLQTWSSSIFHLRSQYLVCIENNSFIVGIGPILDKEL